MTGTEYPGAEGIPGARNCIAVPRPGIRGKPSLSERQLEPKVDLLMLGFLTSYFIRNDAFPSLFLQLWKINISKSCELLWDYSLI